MFQTESSTSRYIGNLISEQKPITCGVQQGSLLGPKQYFETILFLLYISTGAQALICISVVCFSLYLFYECLYIAF
jgi:hypothetical protein